MSKQSDARKEQGYTPNPVLKVCKNCSFFTSEFVAGDEKYNAHIEYERNMRCVKGMFAVKKMASCNDFSQKQEGVKA